MVTTSSMVYRSGRGRYLVTVKVTADSRGGMLDATGAAGFFNAAGNPPLACSFIIIIIIIIKKIINLMCLGFELTGKLRRVI